MEEFVSFSIFWDVFFSSGQQKRRPCLWFSFHKKNGGFSAVDFLHKNQVDFHDHLGDFLITLGIFTITLGIFEHVANESVKLSGCEKEQKRPPSKKSSTGAAAFFTTKRSKKHKIKARPR